MTETVQWLIESDEDTPEIKMFPTGTLEGTSRNLMLMYLDDGKNMMTTSFAVSPSIL